MQKQKPTMRIAVNTRLLLKNRLEGIGWFTYETFRRIVVNNPEHTFFFLFDRPFAPEFIFAPNVTPVILSPQSRHPVLWYMWFEHSVSKFLKNNNIDVFFSPDGYLSLSTNVPQVVAIHDINFFHNPDRLPKLAGWYMNHFTPKFVNKAQRIITVSNFSKSDICSSYGIDGGKVDVVYNGVGENFIPLPKSEVEKVRAEVSGGNPYFVFVGAFNPRKNISGLINAFGVFKFRTNSKFKLLIIGEKMFKAKEINQAYKKSAFKEDIILLGRQSRKELQRVVGAASAMVYPSFFEGFGVPLVEAMNCDIPLAVSKTTSLPEVAGDAAIYFDPASVDQIANAMQQLASDQSLCETLVNNGRQQRTKFSWDKSANQLFDIIASVGESEKTKH